jgi:phosphopantothenoylcysteine decarboxylase
MSTSRNIVLGVTGSIAAYKAAELTSQLTQKDCDVHVVLTADALRFITPVCFKVLSRNPVITDLYEDAEGWKPAHIKLADEANLLLIAPATANTMAKLALGLANDALSCVALALNPQARTLIAPAMNGKMWLHPATQENVAKLKARGVEFIGPEEGLLSCGYEGLGRLWPTDQVAKRALEILGQPAPRQPAAQ